MAATSASNNIIFQDVFTVSDVDRDGKKFDRVSRIRTEKSQNHDMTLALDINTDLLPLQANNTISFALATSLLADGEKEAAEGAGSWRHEIEGSLADDWDYVMYGKIYKFDEDTQERVTAYASFGGLLMALSGSYRHVSGLNVGEYCYLLIRQ